MLVPVSPVRDPGRLIACSSWAGELEGEHRESLVTAKCKQRCQSKAGDLLEAVEEMYDSLKS